MRLECAVIIGLAFLPELAPAEEAPTPRSDGDRAGYALGVSMARNIQRGGGAVDTEWTVKGLRDGLSGQPLLLTDEELRATMGRLEAERTRKKASPAPTAKEAKLKGEAFLAENGRKDGVVTLPSGLQYRVLKAGEGVKPTDADQVVCHYRGTLIDGTEFDSSQSRGRPATFEVARVIPGWREALKLMPVGSRWQLFIPPELAYGERGLRGKRKAPARIGPNATLVFETELLGVKQGPGNPSTKVTTTAAIPSAGE